MKKSKIIAALAAAVTLCVGGAALSACGEETHTHSWEWKSGETEHWQVCKEDDTEKEGSRGEHTGYDTDGVCDTCGKTGLTITPQAPEAPAGTTKIIATKTGATEFTLDATTKKVTVALDDITVKYASATADLGTVPAEDVTIKLKKQVGANLVEVPATDIQEGGVYQIDCAVACKVNGTNRTLHAPIEVKIKATLTGIEVEGTKEVVQYTKADVMPKAWTYKAVYTNGYKKDLTYADVEVTGVNTAVHGAGAATVTYEENDCDGTKMTASETVNYTVTEDTQNVLQSYALNFSYLTEEQKADIVADKIVSVQDGRFEFVSVAEDDKGKIDSHNKEHEANGKKYYFAGRLKVNGGSNAVDAPRYIKVKADGPATLTYFAYNNGDKEGVVSSNRHVAVYSSYELKETTVTDDKGNDTVKKEPTFTNMVGEAQATVGKTMTVHTVDIDKAGNYYITCDAAMTFLYVQLDQRVPKDTNQAVTLEGGEAVTQKIEVKAPKEQTEAPHFAVGETFTHEGYTVKATKVNKVTCKMEEVDVTAQATFVCDTTNYGEKTATVTYDGKEATYKVIVESNVVGVWGIEAALQNPDKTYIDEGTKLTLTKADFAVTTAGTTPAAVTDYIVKYKDAELPADGVQLDIADAAYVFTIEATMANNRTGTTDNTLFTATVSVKVSKKIAADALQDVEVNSTHVATLGDSATITQNTELINNANGSITIMATATKDQSVAIDKSGKSCDGKDFTHRIKLGGTGTTTYRSIRFDVKAACKIVVYAMASSSSATRTVQLLNEEGTAVETKENVGGSALVKLEFTVTAPGKYYFASTTGGVNVCGAIIDYTQA